MTHDAHHEHLVKKLTQQLEPVYSASPQGIYLYLDDEHKSCNEKFAEMLGYASAEEWAKNEFPVGDVSEKDRDRVIEAYMEASRDFKASTVSAALTTKDGKTLQTEVIMVPLSFKNEVFVLHFITPSK